MSDLFTIAVPAPVHITEEEQELLRDPALIRKRIVRDDDYFLREALKYIDLGNTGPFDAWLADLDEEDADALLTEFGLNVGWDRSSLKEVEVNFYSVKADGQPHDFDNAPETIKNYLLRVAKEVIYRALADIGTAYYDDVNGVPVIVPFDDERGTGIFWDGEFNMNVAHTAYGPQPLFVSGGWERPDGTAPTKCFTSLVFLEAIGLFDEPFQTEGEKHEDSTTSERPPSN